MAHFSESLCEEVISSEGKCGLTRNEMVQMARFALQAIRQQNPLLVDAIRYRWFRENWGVEYDGPNSLKLYTIINSRFRRGLSEPMGFDAAIDGAMAGSRREPQNREGEKNA